MLVIVICAALLIDGVAAITDLSDGGEKAFDEEGKKEWGYAGHGNYGPAEWGDHYPDCGSSMQSPINIITDDILEDSKLEPVDLSGYGTLRHDLSMTLVNRGGHTAKVIFKGNDLITIEGGSLPARYYLDEFHFHWGHEDEMGSEHTLDNKPFPMEIHLVHHQEGKNNTFSHAYGLGVVGFFFEISDTANPAIDKLIPSFQNIITPDQEFVLPNFKLSELLPPMDNGRLKSYFRYFGSLTVPPCYESVIWTVAKDRIPISKIQMAKFRTLKDPQQKPIGDVYRPTQPMNKRRVSTQPEPMVGHSSRNVGNIALLFLSLVTLVVMMSKSFR